MGSGEKELEVVEEMAEGGEAPPLIVLLSLILLSLLVPLPERTGGKGILKLSVLKTCKKKTIRTRITRIKTKRIRTKKIKTIRIKTTRIKISKTRISKSKTRTKKTSRKTSSSLINYRRKMLKECLTHLIMMKSKHRISLKIKN